MTSTIQRIFGALLFVALAGAVSARADTDPAAYAKNVEVALSRSLPPETLAVLDGAVAAASDAVLLEGLGHALLMRRHLDEATYLYAAAVMKEPTRPSALTALGVAALERAALGEQPDYPAIIALQRAAYARLPKEPAVMVNLGTALLRAGQAGGDRTLIDEAVGILRQADLKDPYPSVLAIIRLAEAEAAAGDMDGAAEALQVAFVRNPFSPRMSVARMGPLASVPFTSGDDSCGRINYVCPVICPGGIIGQINRVSCEESQTDAQLACQAGQPFPVSYDCDNEIPTFGILIPGLYPGFSIVTPWVSIDVLLQGNGRVDFKAKAIAPEIAGVQPFLDAEGSYNPHSGATEWDLGYGMQYALFNTDPAKRFALFENSPVMEKVNEFDFGPSTVVRYDVAHRNIKARLEAGRGVLLTD